MRWLKSLLGRPKKATRVDVERLRSARTRTVVYHHDEGYRDKNWSLLEEGRYEEAAEGFLQQARETKWPAHLRNRAIAFLCLKRFSEAYAAYEEADTAEQLRTPAHHRDLAQMGLCLWLAGDRDGALPLVVQNLELRMRNKLSYGDAAGGASEGLIAYYVGVSLPDTKTRTQAVKHLKKIAAAKRHRGWPNPIAKYLVDELPLADVLLQAAETADVALAIEHAHVDTLCRRQLTEALFYAAIKRRDEGDEQRCLELLATVAELPLSPLEIECFLARDEVVRRRAGSLPR